MTYTIELSEHVDKIFAKLAKKDPKKIGIIDKKLSEIRQNPSHYKMLKGSMHGTQRVHIDSHFVLTFEVDEEKRVVRILDYAHHDEIYE